MSRPIDFEVPVFGAYRYAAVVARDYLLTRVPVDYAVTTLIPSPRLAKVVVVRTAPTSGQMNPVLSKRRLIIWCYDLTEVLACDTAELVRGYMFEAMFKLGSGIRETRIVGEPAYLPDPDDPAKTPRAQLTVDVLLRARFTIPGS